MVTSTESDDDSPILEPPYYTRLRIYTGHFCFIAYLLVLVFGQYTRLVYYRTSHCVKGECIYSAPNRPNCSRCDDNLIDKYFLTVVEQKYRSGEIMWLILELHLLAFTLLFNAVGIYWFNFALIGTFFGFQFANTFFFILNCLYYIGSDFFRFIFGSNFTTIFFWCIMYGLNVGVICATAFIYKEYLRIREASGKI